MNSAHAWKSSIVLALLTGLMLSVVVLGGGLGVAEGQQAVGNIVSYRVTGAPDYAHPGNESFWSSISWTEVPLAASVSPGGGHTPDVLVKSANDGFNIYVLFEWNDSVGPSFGSSTEMYQAPNGTLVPLDPASTAQVKQLFYNSTYYYPDRVAMLWFLPQATGRQQSPAMSLGSDGAITGGAAEIWHWQSSPTDNNSNDTGFPGGYTDPSGTAIFPPDNVSFAEDDFTNTTGFYVIGGSFGAGMPNLDPYADPFAVHAGNSFSDGSWTVEMVRSFTQSDASNYRVQLTTGANYYVAFAVWNGKLGESSEIKSVSQWYTLTISDQAPAISVSPSPTQTSPAGVTLEQAIATGAALLIVGIIIGITVKPKSKQK